MSELFGIEWVPLPTAAEMAELDRRAQSAAGVSERVLMEAAGRAVAAVVNELYPQGRVGIGAGPGHNGGDAWVTARALAAWGREVRIVEAKPDGAGSAVGHGWRLSVAGPEDAAAVFGSSDVLVDGLLGTGARGAPRGVIASLIEAMNASGRPVIAVDGPSGIDYTSGDLPGVSVRAAVTVALGYPKRGCLFQPGRDRCGRLLAVEIGFPPVEPSSVSAQVLTPDWARARLPRRAPDAHKGSAGYLLVCAGTHGMAGAAALAARAALRAGVGLVRVLSDPANREILQSLVPEAIFVDADDESAVAESAEWAHAVVVGPGLGRSAAARRRLERVIASSRERPLLLDADALNLLCEHPETLERVGAARPLALTPHPGEASRLIGAAVADIKRDPIAVAGTLAERFHAAVLLKGAPSVVVKVGAPALVNSSGTSAVATGGSGDVLAGACGAMLAAGVPPREALGLGLFYAGRGAELLARRRGVTSLDLAESVALALQNPGADGPPRAWPFVVFDQPPRE